MADGFKDKTILITGATGLIGQSLVRHFAACGAKVISLVRDIEKARRMFGEDERISYIVTDITRLDTEGLDIDYIIHAASVTSSRAFIDDPVGVSFTAVEGTRRVLELAKNSGIKSMVYLSSMEVYGAPASDEKIYEDHASNIDTMQVRSAYPESKRMCESLCASYHSQFGVPVKVIRLTQTFGPGVRYDDGRVFAEFVRCVIEGRDIVLHTKGETKRSYLYTEDAVSAVETVLLKGTDGEAYNAANEDTYCSIREMAELVASECAPGSIGVVIEDKGNAAAFGYAPVLKMNLSTDKLKALGWEAKHPLKEMYEKMCEWMRENKHREDKRE
ncbi:MAG: NAD(P)-dependent oxidoreductase [Lachnospiraceae bacterium]|nr:NAD(P)-dependent oxidoreductase [Lachnospiraceae bacterium]